MSIKFITANVNGLGDQNKGDMVMNRFWKTEAQCILLQETHSTEETQHLWKRTWPGEIYFSHGTSNARGVAILLREKQPNVHQVVGEDGRTLLMDVTIQKQRFTICNIYAPNYDAPDFFKTILERVMLLSNEKIIVGGDLNLPLDPYMDKQSANKNITHRKSREILEQYMEETEMSDPWRITYPEGRQYTFFHGGIRGGPKSRLDYILMSPHALLGLKGIKITPGFCSDHSQVELIWKGKEGDQPVSRLWRFDKSLLKDETFNTKCEERIYYTRIENRGARPDIMWDTIKATIRDEAMQYIKVKRIKDKENIEQMELNIFIAQQEAMEHDNKKQAYLTAKQKLEDYFQERIIEKMHSNQTLFYEDYEKSSKLFFATAKTRTKKMAMQEVVTDSGKRITHNNQILEEQKNFYRKLYDEDSWLEDTKGSKFYNQEDTPKLEEKYVELFKKGFESEELETAMKGLANGKTPGLDGIPVELYKQFWKKIQIPFEEMIQYAEETGNLPKSMKEGVICTIPKKGKDLKKIGNWRPISLLTVDYKILSKAYATRIKKVLPLLINRDQRGFVPFRFLGENIQDLQMLIEKMEQTQEEGLLMVLDFQKAFDSVSWECVKKALELFGFPTYMEKMFITLCKGFTSRITNEGQLSDTFQIKKGVLQGAPASPSLFVLVGELLAIRLKTNKNIEPIKVNGNSKLLNQFADDLNLSIKADNENLRETIKTLDDFAKISGLKLNKQKSSIYKLGAARHWKANMEAGGGFQWKKGEIESLGVTLHDSGKQMNFANFHERLPKIHTAINIWQGKYVSMLGRNLLSKASIASRLIFQLALLPSPPKEFLEDIQARIMRFVWNGTNKVKRAVMHQTAKKGGVKMVDIELQDKALKLAWIPRLLNNQQAFWAKCVQRDVLYPIETILEGNLNEKDMAKILKDTISPYWKQTFMYYAKYSFNPKPTTEEDILAQPLYLNSLIKTVEGRHLYIQDPGR